MLSLQAAKTSDESEAKSVGCNSQPHLPRGNMYDVKWSDLKPCPECGSDILDVESRDAIRFNKYFYCLSCKFEADASYNQDEEECYTEAMRFWNTSTKDDQ